VSENLIIKQLTEDQYQIESEDPYGDYNSCCLILGRESLLELKVKLNDLFPDVKKMREKCETFNRVRNAYLCNKGITIRQISSILGIGHGTVTYHLERIPEYKRRKNET
jgi:hypothetical protein